MTGFGPLLTSITTLVTFPITHHMHLPLLSLFSRSCLLMIDSFNDSICWKISEVEWRSGPAQTPNLVFTVHFIFYKSQSVRCALLLFYLISYLFYLFNLLDKLCTKSNINNLQSRFRSPVIN